MTVILDEIRKALKANLCYLAVTSSLSLPDICCALASPDGETTRDRYKAWCREWLKPPFPLTDVDMWKLRSGVVHQGTFGHPQNRYSRVIFTLPGSPAQGVLVSGTHVDFNPEGLREMATAKRRDPLILNSGTFCETTMDAVFKWHSVNRNDPHVLANMPRLIQLRPPRIKPYYDNYPVIA
jgi:hypothetical protein